VLEALDPALKDRAKFKPPLRVEEFLEVAVALPLESTFFTIFLLESMK
jgi:hypothetical protein